MTVLIRRCIERAIEHGCQELDQLVRMDQEKLRWGGQARPMVNLIVADPWLRSRAAMRLHEWSREGRRLTAQVVASAERAPAVAHSGLWRRHVPSDPDGERRSLGKEGRQ